MPWGVSGISNSQFQNIPASLSEREPLSRDDSALCGALLPNVVHYFLNKKAETVYSDWDCFYYMGLWTIDKGLGCRGHRGQTTTLRGTCSIEAF